VVTVPSGLSSTSLKIIKKNNKDVDDEERASKHMKRGGHGLQDALWLDRDSNWKLSEYSFFFAQNHE
jgi:hypothetical protein